MRTINIMYSNKDDILSVKGDIGKHPSDQILIQIFSGIHDLALAKRLLGECVELFPKVAIIGATSFGEIIGSTIKERSIIISFSLFKKTKVRSLLIRQNNDLRAAGRGAVEFFKSLSPRALIVYACGLKDGRVINNIQFLNELRDGLGKTVIAGGQAGVYDFSEKPFVFTEKGISKEGFALASLSGATLEIGRMHDTSWVSLGMEMTITKMFENRVYEIDNTPVNEIYDHYLGIEKSKKSEFLINRFPLISKRDGFSTTNLVTKINSDGSFEYLSRFYPGELVHFGFCDLSNQEEGVKRLRQSLTHQKPESVFVYSCPSRRLLLGENMTIDMAALEGLASSSGFFTYGEFYSDANYKPHLLFQTMTILALSEASKTKGRSKTADEVPASKNEDSLRLQIVKALGHLVSVTTQELKNKNSEFYELASRDTLTGLSNRRVFNERLAKEIKLNNRSKTPLSIIMFDVDFFKQFNDIYGHVTGDDCLRAIGDVLTAALGRTSDSAFRYGGEEFSCLLSCTDYRGALKVAERIRDEVEKLQIPHEGSSISKWVTVSLGVITLNCSADSDPAVLVNLCDEQLYNAKSRGRNRVAGTDISLRG